MELQLLTKMLVVASLVALAGLVELVSSADPAQLVTGLPGQPQVGFKQYAGHISVNSTAGKSLFYWFFEADTNSSTSNSMPLVLWLNGGPGCSSVGTGALSELGPFRPSDNGLALNPYSWNKAANIIFLESPVGVGFSFTKSTYSLTDDLTAKDNLQFLVEWFRKFPEYSKNDFYVTGESYAGHYIPMLASHVLAYNSQGGSINFKGFAIGNGWTAGKPEEIANIHFLHSHSVISNDVFNYAINCYSSPSSQATNDACLKAQQGISHLTRFINDYNIYKDRDNCSVNTGQRIHSFKQLLIGVYQSCSDRVSSFLNSPTVQAALHVTNRPVKWSSCSDRVRALYSDDDFDSSMLPLYSKLLKSGLRIWIYSGDFDAAVSTLATRSWLDVLNLPIDTPWYAWSYNNQVGGWTEIYKDLTFATVRGAGHMVPADQPGPALALFKTFLQGKSLPGF